MIEINAKYEILYNDLMKLSVGKFLVAREYKIMLLKLGYHEMWQAVKKQAENDRNFVSTGMDHDRYDSEKGLILVLNHIDEEPEIKKFIFNLILNFIAFKKEKTNFDDLKDSIELLGFEGKYQLEIENQINLHESKYPFNEIKEDHVMKNEVITPSKEEKKRVFIVHGHKEGELNILARLLEKQGLKPIILNEQPSEGMTIIEKFEANSSSDFAIILLTGDDKGNQKDQDSLNLRARQNVIFEMGYFFALLGRKNVVCLQEEQIEVPSDLGGRMYIKLDKANNWKIKLIQELKHAGFNVTADKI